jgi:hypothetical protein
MGEAMANLLKLRRAGVNPDGTGGSSFWRVIVGVDGADDELDLYYSGSASQSFVEKAAILQVWIKLKVSRKHLFIISAELGNW